MVSNRFSSTFTHLRSFHFCVPQPWSTTLIRIITTTWKQRDLWRHVYLPWQVRDLDRARLRERQRSVLAPAREEVACLAEALDDIGASNSVRSITPAFVRRDAVSSRHLPYMHTPCPAIGGHLGCYSWRRLFKIGGKGRL